MNVSIQRCFMNIFKEVVPPVLKMIIKMIRYTSVYTCVPMKDSSILDIFIAICGHYEYPKPYPDGSHTSCTIADISNNITSSVCTRVHCAIYISKWKSRLHSSGGKVVRFGN